MKVNLWLLLVQIAVLAIAFGVILFGAAGTLAWSAGWVWMVAFFGFVAALSLWLLRYNPGLLQERMTGVGSEGQKTWDREVLTVVSVAFVAWLLIMPLDAVRFHWTSVPSWGRLLGAALLVGSFGLLFAVFRENTYLSPAVRIQRDRGQSVVSTGPYHYVRHPMYAAIIPFTLGTTLMLGSWLGVAASFVLLVTIAWRAVREEQTLRAELPGYDAYMRNVRFRFLPHVW